MTRERRRELRNTADRPSPCKGPAARIRFIRRPRRHFRDFSREEVQAVRTQNTPPQQGARLLAFAGRFLEAASRTRLRNGSPRSSRNNNRAKQRGSKAPTARTGRTFAKKTPDQRRHAPQPESKHQGADILWVASKHLAALIQDVARRGVHANDASPWPEFGVARLAPSSRARGRRPWPEI